MPSLRDTIRDWMNGLIGPSRISIRDLGELYCKSEYPDLSAWTLDEMVERKALLARDILLDEYNNAIANGVPPLFSFSSSYSSIFDTVLRFDDKSWAYPYPSITKMRIISLPYIIEAMQCLDARDSLAFEVFCCDILRPQGYSLTLLPIRKREGGCDFYGYFERRKILKKAIHTGIYPGHVGEPAYRVFGQAKRRISNVGVEETHTFVNQYEECSRNRGRAYSLLPEDFCTSPLYLKGLFCTSSNFTPEAQHVLTGSGVQFRVGLQLAWDIIFFFDAFFEQSGRFNKDEFVAHYSTEADNFYNS